MKKRKINLLLEIATLCLCVAAIAFGVYSAKTANLNVTGTIGFNAHNVEYDVVGWIYGHAGDDSKPVAKDDKVELGKNSEGALILGAREFSDLGDSGNPETINVVLQITNNSAFNIMVKADLTNSASDDKSISITAPISTIILGTTNADKTGTIQFALTISADTQKIELDNSVSLKVDLNKVDLKESTVAIKEFTTAEKEAIKTGLGSIEFGEVYEYTDTILCYAERFPYYVEMGEYNSTKLRWLIVGTSADDGTITALSEEDRTAFGLGLMLNKTYVMLSEKVLLIDTDSAMPFQNQFTYSGDYLNDYGYSAQDYATSNIRQYLIGNTVKNNSTLEDGKYIAGGTDVNIMTKYNLNNTDPMYANIKARSLESLYNESAISGETRDMLTVPTSKDGYTAVNFTGDTPDKLWLLSQTEMQKIFKADYRTGNGPNVYMSSRTSVLNNSSAATWLLRSPHPRNALYVRGLGDDGSLFDISANYTNPGVRPAFLF